MCAVCAVPTRDPVEIVFFDLDDTLFDHTFSVRAGLASLAGASAPFAGVPLARLEELYVAKLEAQHPQVLAGTLTPDQARAARFALLCEACDASDEPTHVERLADTYRATYQTSRRTVAGAVELLLALRARRPPVRIGIITNNLVSEQREKLAFLKLAPLVDVLVISEEAGASKPDPAIFRVALERAGCHAERAIMLGDAWATDVLGARAAGLRAAWLNRHGRPCPDPSLCVELSSLSPTDAALAAILGERDADERRR